MHSFKSYLRERNQTDTIHDFISFAARYLQLKDKPDVDLLEKQKKNMTAANFNIETKKTKVYCKGRATADICRSIAHELVHQRQLETLSEPLDGSTGSKHEDEANSVAGRIVREYGRTHPSFYE